MDAYFQDFITHRGDYMSEEQIAEIYGTVARPRTSEARAEMTPDQRAAMNEANSLQMLQARADTTADEQMP
jgi:hypothetical protein